MNKGALVAIILLSGLFLAFFTFVIKDALISSMGATGALISLGLAFIVFLVAVVFVMKKVL